MQNGSMKILLILLGLTMSAEAYMPKGSLDFATGIPNFIHLKAVLECSRIVLGGETSTLYVSGKNDVFLGLSLKKTDNSNTYLKGNYGSAWGCGHGCSAYDMFGVGFEQRNYWENSKFFGWFWSVNCDWYKASNKLIPYPNFSIGYSISTPW